MKCLLSLALVVLAAPAAALGQAPGGALGITPAGNPSALIAAEVAFARLARERGQWPAFAATAAEAAEMFAPQRVLAKLWLKGRANPAQPLQWQPHAAWISCDGSAGATFGAYQGSTGEGGSGQGWFSNLWQRQKKGGYKWLLDQGGDLAAPLAAPEFLAGKVANCRACPQRDPAADEESEARPPRDALKRRDAIPLQRPLAGPIPALAAAAGSDSKDGQSDDGTLAWRSTVMPGGTREWTVWLWQDGKMTEVLHRTEAARNEG